jgi:2-haloacid dehalogenase
VLELSNFDCISFDCYGTLIDWETGILGYLQPLLFRKGRTLTDEQVLAHYSEFEPREQSGEYRSYREVLASVVLDFARELNFAATEAEVIGLADTIQTWQPFGETVPTLRRLQERLPLAILSNIDDDLFAHSAQNLQVKFECVVTAQQARGYKPSLKNFALLLEKLAIPPSRLLHVAESLYHDVRPATSLGIATVWVNRRQGKAAAASKFVEVRADLEVPNLTTLAGSLAFGHQNQ